MTNNKWHHYLSQSFSPLRRLDDNIINVFNQYDTCLMYYQERILTPTHYAGRQYQVCPILAVFLCKLVVLNHLPPNLPKFYGKGKAIGQTFMIFVINTHAFFTAQRMAGILDIDFRDVF